MLPSSPLARTEATGSGVRSAEVMTCVRGLRGGWGSVRSLSHASAKTTVAASDALMIASRLDSLNLKGIVLILEVWYTKDRKSTRLNSSHQIISYAVFCLK